MTLREMLADWWCKFSLSMTEYCQDRFDVLPKQVTWIDFTFGRVRFHNSSFSDTLDNTLGHCEVGGG